MQSMIYRLEKTPRLLASPLPLSEVGWLVHHCYIPKREIPIGGAYICLCFNYQPRTGAAKRGEAPSAQFLMLPPSHVLVPDLNFFHDELFLKYSSDLYPVLRSMLRCDEFRFRNISLSPEIKKIVSEIREQLASLPRPGVADKLDALALKFITEMMVSHATDDRQYPQLKLKLYEIAAKLKNGGELPRLIRQYGFSRSAFYSAWNEVFDESPTQFQLNSKLEQAALLLLSSGMSVTEIAAASGFSGNVYFHERFKKRYGMSPGQYRRRHGAAE